MSGPKGSLATEIDREILELRNFFEDHREEMMSLLQDPEGPMFGIPPPKRNINSGRSDSILDPQNNRSEMPKFSHSKPDLSASTMHPEYPVQFSSLQYRDSDSGADRTLQLRRIEFEKRRMRKELKRRKQKLRQTSSGGEDSLNAALEHNMLERSLPDDRWPFYAGRYDGDQRYADPDLDIKPRFNDINWQSGPKHGQCNEPDRHSDYISRHSGDETSDLTSGRGREQGEDNRNSISSFFPVGQLSNRKVQSEDESSFPSLPPPHTPSLPHPSPSPLPQDDNSLDSRVNKDDWKHSVPRLDLEDIWSDVTSRGHSVEVSMPSLHLAAFAHLPEEGETYRSSLNILMQDPLKHNSVQSTTSRSVGCDTKDLGLPGKLNRLSDQVAQEASHCNPHSTQAFNPRSTEELNPLRSSTLDIRKSATKHDYSRELFSSRSQVIVVSPRSESGLRKTVSSLELGGTSWEEECSRIIERLRGESPVIIINHNKCLSNDGALPDVPKTPQSTRDVREMNAACQTDSRQQQKTTKKNAKRRKRKPQDLSTVLRSLDAANDLAQRLKHRSEQMLDILATEISGIAADP